MRADYDAEKYKLVFAGGYSGTQGIFHTGIGPFDSDGVGVGYGTMRYSRGAMKFNVFTNILNGDATGLLAIGVTEPARGFTPRPPRWSRRCPHRSSAGSTRR